MQHLLDVLPVWLALVLFAAIPAIIAAVLHDAFRRFVKSDVLIPHHDVAGFLVSIVGLMFAVVLAFLVAAAWGNFDAAQRNADTEASDVAESFATAGVLPQPTQRRVRTLLADYAFRVRDFEWPLLADDRQDLRARDLLLKVFETVARAPIRHNASIGEAFDQSSSQQIVVNNLEAVSNDRRKRLIDAARQIPGALYLALIFGWMLLTAFVFLFGCSRVLQLTMTALVTGMIGLLFGVVVEFDRPYSNGLRVTSEAWTFVIENNNMERFRTPVSAP